MEIQSIAVITEQPLHCLPVARQFNSDEHDNVGIDDGIGKRPSEHTLNLHLHSGYVRGNKTNVPTDTEAGETTAVSTLIAA